MMNPLEIVSEFAQAVAHRYRGLSLQHVLIAITGGELC
jgi:hypothetical protein